MDVGPPHEPAKSRNRIAWWPAEWKYELQAVQRHIRASIEPPSRLVPRLIAGTPFTPQNVLATLYRLLGIDPTAAFPDFRGWPMSLLDDPSPIDQLL